MGEVVVIRKMRPEDRRRIREICCQTGFGGESIEPIFDDPELFADLWSSYYTDFEPESAFVAEHIGEVVGYLLGCLDTRRYNRILFGRLAPRLLGRTLTGRYHIGEKTRAYFRSLIAQLLRGEVVNPPLKEYPAHLHINIAAGCRRMGIGSLLMESYLAYLREKGVRGVHLGTSSLHTSALPFYEKLGFQLFGKKPTLFLGKKIDSIAYVKRL